MRALSFVAPIMMAILILSACIVLEYDTDDSDAPATVYEMDVIEVTDEYFTFTIGDHMFRQYNDGKIRYVATATMTLNVIPCFESSI